MPTRHGAEQRHAETPAPLLKPLQLRQDVAVPGSQIPGRATPHLGQDQATQTRSASSHQQLTACCRWANLLNVFRHTALNCHQCGCLLITESRSWSTELEEVDVWSHGDLFKFLL